MPHHHMVLPHYMGRSKEIDIDEKKDKDKRKGIGRQDSFSSESPMQDIPLLLPQEADGLDTSNGDHKNLSGNSPLLSQKLEHETLVSDTQMKGFQDEVVPLNLGAQPVANALDDWWETPEETNDDITLEYGEVGPRTTCHCQVSMMPSWIFYVKCEVFQICTGPCKINFSFLEQSTRTGKI